MMCRSPEASCPHQNLCNAPPLPSVSHQVGGGALAAVHAVKVCGHEDARAALGALLTQAGHLAGVIHLMYNIKEAGTANSSYMSRPAKTRTGVMTRDSIPPDEPSRHAAAAAA